MMDMLSSTVAMTLIALVVVAGAGGFIAMRVLGARAVEGDHPGEKGYTHRRHSDD